MPRKSAHKFASTWAEDMNAYSRNKCDNAPEMLPMKRFSRRAAESQTITRRDYNIVTGDASTAEASSTYQRQQLEATQSHIDRGVNRSLKGTDHPYDVISMRPLYGISDEKADELIRSKGAPKATKKPKEDVREFDILNHTATNHPNAIANEEKPRTVKLLPAKRRERSILNHRYYENHEQRTDDDRSEELNKMLQLAAKDRQRNPLTGVLYNVDAAETEKSEVQAKQQDHSKKALTHTFKVSNIVGRSEGHAFDIVTNQVYNPDYVLKLEQTNIKGLPQRASLRQEWEYRRDVEEAERDYEVGRALNRVSTERLKEPARRGHHVLTNQPFGLSRSEELSGKTMDPTLGAQTAAPPVPVSSLKDKSTMERLHQTTEPKAWTTSTVVRENGPRSTYERVFNSAPTAIAANLSTFDGRRKLLLPTLEKCKSSTPMRQML